MKPIGLYWWRHSDPKISNVGDALNPIIVEFVSGRPVVYRDIESADLAAIGSILEIVSQASRETPIHVWGAGFIQKAPSTNPENLILAAVRGPHTRRQLGQQQTELSLGDPGLLIDRIYPRSSSAQYSIGVVPHYVDMNLPIINELTQTHHIISPLLSPREFVSEISKCEVVVSSSLHGLVTADSLHIPNQWIKLSDKVIGDGFKFRDYLALFKDQSQEPVIVSNADGLTAELAAKIGDEYSRPNLEKIKDDLVSSFSNNI